LKILLVHTQDQPQFLTGEKWDLLVDLGWAPNETYARWRREFQCPAIPLAQYSSFDQELDFMQALSAKGCDLIDKKNINWWQFFLLYFSEQIQSVCRLHGLAESLQSDDQVFVTRPCIEAQMLRHLRNSSVYPLRDATAHNKLRHYLRELWTLPFWELRQIFWDKYDPSFGLRRHFARKKQNETRPVVLVPSTYINASRTAMNFAADIPQQDFLLITTRASGRIRETPGNVHSTDLVAYVSEGNFKVEYEEVLRSWRNLSLDLIADNKTTTLANLRFFDDFPKFVSQGLRIRNAWENVLKSEPIQAVLCCDNNPYTLLPVLLGKQKGVPTVSCHHGALDWRFRILPAFADVVIAKGEMEHDYLSRLCRVPEGKIRVEMLHARTSRSRKHESHPDDSIVFFSEAYEPNGARGDELYRELLPQLANIAIKEQRALVIKLHPFESVRKRKALARRVLTKAQRQVVKFAAVPLTQEFLHHVWFGVTVLSTVAMECEAVGVPCFVCEWLKYPHHDYGDQFRRFEIGHSLQSIAEIADIPAMLDRLSRNSRGAHNSSQVPAPSNLEQIFSPEVESPLLTSSHAD
jgi:hypothetical protein